MQVVVLLLLVAGLALLVLGLITASTPLVLASAAASLLAGYAISRYRRAQAAKPAAATPEPEPVGAAVPTRSSAVTVAELARAVAAERAATGRAAVGSAAAVGLTAAGDGRPVAGVPAPAALAGRLEPALGAGPAHGAPATIQPAEPTGWAAHAAPSRGDGELAEQDPATRSEAEQDLAGSGEADPPVAETDPPLRSRGAEPVWVIDGRPRYHLSGCDYLRDRAAEPVPLRQAVEDGFTPCGLCDPDTGLAAR